MSTAWRGELWKIATVRGQWVGVVLASAALPLTSLLVAATGGLGPHDTATSGAASGAVVALVAYGAWAAALSAGEYSRQTIMVSLATVPRRASLYTAKLAALAAVAGAAALVSVALSLGAVRAVSSPAQPLGDPAALVGVVVVVLAVVVTGAAVGLLTRSPSAAMAVMTAAVLGPAAAGGLLGGLQRWVVGASPGTVVTQLVGGAQLSGEQAFPGGPGMAAVSLLLVAAAVAGAGAVVFLRRDG